MGGGRFTSWVIGRSGSSRACPYRRYSTSLWMSERKRESVHTLMGRCENARSVVRIQSARCPCIPARHSYPCHTRRITERRSTPCMSDPSRWNHAAYRRTDAVFCSASCRCSSPSRKVLHIALWRVATSSRSSSSTLKPERILNLASPCRDWREYGERSTRSSPGSYGRRYPRSTRFCVFCQRCKWWRPSNLPRNMCVLIQNAADAR